MNEYLLVGLIVTLLVIVICVIFFISKDPYQYDPNYNGLLIPKLEGKPEYKQFIEDVDFKNSVVNARYGINCQNCNSEQTGFFHPLTPRNCNLCASFINGHKREIAGVL